jgi:hypothetical protein
MTSEVCSAGGAGTCCGGKFGRKFSLKKDVKSLSSAYVTETGGVCIILLMYTSTFCNGALYLVGCECRKWGVKCKICEQIEYGSDDVPGR